MQPTLQLISNLDLDLPPGLFDQDDTLSREAAARLYKSLLESVAEELAKQQKADDDAKKEKREAR